jgi:hypothetical protein
VAAKTGAVEPGGPPPGLAVTGPRG